MKNVIPSLLCARVAQHTGFEPSLDPVSFSSPRFCLRATDKRESAHILRVNIYIKRAVVSSNVGISDDEGKRWLVKTRTTEIKYFVEDDDGNEQQVGASTIVTTTTVTSNGVGGTETEITTTGEPYGGDYDSSSSTTEVDYSDSVTLDFRRGLVTDKLAVSPVLESGLAFSAWVPSGSLVALELVKIVMKVSLNGTSVEGNVNTILNGYELGDNLEHQYSEVGGPYRSAYGAEVSSPNDAIVADMGWSVFSGGLVMGWEADSYVNPTAGMWTSAYKMLSLADGAGSVRVVLYKNGDEEEALTFSSTEGGETAAQSFTTVINEASYGDPLDNYDRYTVAVEVVPELDLDGESLKILRRSNSPMNGHLYQDHVNEGRSLNSSYIRLKKLDYLIPRDSRLWGYSLIDQGAIEVSSEGVYLTGSEIKASGVGMGILPYSETEDRNYVFGVGDLFKAFLGLIS